MTVPRDYPPGWPQPYPGFTPPPSGRGNGLGIASLVLGIVGLAVCWVPVVGVFVGVSAVVAGVVARRRLKRGGQDNYGIAVTGIVLGTLATLVCGAITSLILFFLISHENCIEHATSRSEYGRCG